LEYWGKGYFNAKGVSIPVAVSVFPDELYPAPRSWAEQAYPKLIHYNKLDKGGHFAAYVHALSWLRSDLKPREPLLKRFRCSTRREVTAFVELVVMNELGYACSASSAGWIEFVREDAHGNRDGDAFGIEIPFAPILP